MSTTAATMRKKKCTQRRRHTNVNEQTNKQTNGGEVNCKMEAYITNTRHKTSIYAMISHSLSLSTSAFCEMGMVALRCYHLFVDIFGLWWWCDVVMITPQANRCWMRRVFFSMHCAFKRIYWNNVDLMMLCMRYGHRLCVAATPDTILKRGNIESKQHVWCGMLLHAVMLVFWLLFLFEWNVHDFQLHSNRKSVAMTAIR